MNKKNKKDKQKLSKLSFNEAVLRMSAGTSYREFWMKLNTYLETRIKARLAIDEFGIELLNKYIDDLKNRKEVSNELKEVICENSIRMIVMSKDINNHKLVDQVSRFGINSMIFVEGGECTYNFFELATKYAPNCLTKKNVKKMIELLSNNEDNLKKTKSLLKDEEFIKVMNQKIDAASLYSELDDIIIPSNHEKKYNYKKEKKLEKLDDKNVITIDSPGSRLLDSAFSVEKKGDLYYLNIYITDVPSFLLENEELIEHAFTRGTCMYNKQFPTDNFRINMLPQFAVDRYLSLNKGGVNKVITFSYCIDQKGNIELLGISRNRVAVKENFGVKVARGYDFEDPKMEEDIGNYKKICSLVSNNSNKLNFRYGNKKRLNDILAFPSILVNYQVGRNSNLAIYRDNGLYVKKSEDKYAYAVTPLRKFVSDINLAMYLNQLGLLKCPNKYVYYLENNMNYIIDYLNHRESLREYFEENYSEIKKYVKNKGLNQQ